MTEREEYELVAKACGFEVSFYGPECMKRLKNSTWHERWDPKREDGDSRRLQVALGIQVTPYPIYEDPKHSVLARKCRLGREDNGIGEPETASIEWIEQYGDNPEAATRLAVWRAAVEYAKSLEK